jgi:hypothetical protein
MRPSPRVGDIFNIGDSVRKSGIYDVLHDNHHPQKHQGTCVYGKTFPPCRGYKNRVQFQLAVGAVHIIHDKEFTAAKAQGR